MKVLVTGAYGNLGTYMVAGLVQAGHTIGASGRNTKPELFHFLTETEQQCITHYQLDCTDANQVALVLAENWDAIIHLASANDNFLPSYASLALNANTWATRVMLDEVVKLKNKPHFVYFSTFHVYGRSTGVITESTPPAPVHDYASTHLFAEEYVKQFHRTHKLPFTIIRLTNSYGAPVDTDTSKWYLVLNDLAKMAFQNKSIVLKSNGQAQRDFVWMPDVVHAIHELLSIAPTNETYNIGQGSSCRLIDIAKAVQSAYLEEYGVELPIQLNDEDKSTHNEPLEVSIAKLQAVIPFKPVVRFAEEAKRVFALLS